MLFSELQVFWHIKENNWNPQNVLSWINSYCLCKWPINSCYWCKLTMALAKWCKCYSISQKWLFLKMMGHDIAGALSIAAVCEMSVTSQLRLKMIQESIASEENSTIKSLCNQPFTLLLMPISPDLMQLIFEYHKQGILVIQDMVLSQEFFEKVKLGKKLCSFRLLIMVKYYALHRNRGLSKGSQWISPISACLESSWSSFRNKPSPRINWNT